MRFLYFFLLSGSGFFLPGLNAAAQVDVRHYGFHLTLHDSTNRIDGWADITVASVSAGRFHLDLAPSMRVSRLTDNGRTIGFARDTSGLTIRVSAGRHHTYRVVYSGVPADGLIIRVNKFGQRTFFGDNWPDRAHQWLPCVDRPGDKAPVDFYVTAPGQYQVVAPGRKLADALLSGHRRLTHWQEKVPIPTKVMVIGVAQFAISAPVYVEGIPVFTYVFPENQGPGFRDYAVATRILPWFIHRLGFYAYEKLANVQSKTIFGGMENASAIFYFENSVGTGRAMESLMAHEIAHQWFGDEVTETDYRHLWLSEGFATYMEHCYRESRYGADTLRADLTHDRRTVLAFVRRHPDVPVVDTGLKGGYMRLLNANSYQKGGWVLHMLRRQLGDSLFWTAIQRYYARYAGRNASTDSLRLVLESVSGQDLRPFFTQWLYTPGVPQIRVTRASPTQVRLEQSQDPLFRFPLEYTVNGRLSVVRVTGRTTLVDVPEGAVVRWDPDVNLLADIEVETKVNP
ncbi:MAG TPA: M1 family metallopeptidase [Dinghuibacter sp.]|uniref:M1 family metallopeptidase n=1 Tax=Dinghuibacter sp. TaxID=2024697 RepID=UPI002BA077EA|nr:M1 family metallopeptidase [Dinghuibacter sp.]HTJ12104.1 M1 family metallopeptidase [Dinghuibacter sp.]